MAVTCVSNLAGGTGNWSSDDTWTIAGQGSVFGHGASIVSNVLTANTGSGATLNITVTSTVITGVSSIGSAGAGYPVSSTIRLRVTGGSGNCGIIEVDTNVSGGVSAFRSIISGGTGYSATTAATTIDWTAWTIDALINHKVKIGSTWYIISDNTATTLTLTSGPADSINVSWTLGGVPLNGDSVYVGNGAGAAFNITASGGAIIGAVNVVSYNNYPVSSILNLGIFDPNGTASGGIISVLTNASGGISAVLSVVSGGTGYATKTNNSSAYFTLSTVTSNAKCSGEIVSAAVFTVGSGYSINSTINLAITGNTGHFGANGILSVTINGSGQVYGTPTVVSGGISYSAAGYATDSYSTTTYDTVVFDVDISAIPTLALVVNGNLNASTTAGAYHLKTTGAISGSGTIRAGTDASTRYPSTCTFTLTSAGSLAVRFQLWCQKPAIRYCRLGSSFKTFTTSGGRGSLCTATITQSGGIINNVTAFPVKGTLYPPSSVIYLTITGGSGTGVISVNTDSSGFVSTFNSVINGGTGYTDTTAATTCPGVFHVTGHSYAVNQPVRVFQTANSLLPVGGSVATPIYTTFFETTTLYIKTVIDANSFTLALTSGGTVLDRKSTR